MLLAAAVSAGCRLVDHSALVASRGQEPRRRWRPRWQYRRCWTASVLQPPLLLVPVLLVLLVLVLLVLVGAFLAAL
jgi:hypothetical protein